MAKIRKNVKRKTYQYQKNRKRMNRNAQKLPKNACKIVEEKWNQVKSTKTNMKRMGLAYDLNSSLGHPRRTANKTDKPPEVPEVIETLEKDASEGKAKGGRKLTKNQVEFITEMLDKYGEDYKKMVLDKKNHYQFTWKQFRRKVNEFKSVPELYNKFLEYRKDKEIDTSAINTCVDDEGEWD